MSKFAVVLPAAGQSSRFKNALQKKVFVLLDGRPVWMHSAERFVSRDDVAQVVLVISPDDREMFREKYAANVAMLGIEVTTGGAARADSVAAALARVKPDVDFVAVHDAARPCLANQWIDAVFHAAEKHGAAILGNPVSATLKRVSGERLIEATVPRDNLWEAQTPQVFRRQLLLDAYARRGDFAATDEAQLVERMGHPVFVAQGSPLNIKVTTPEDMRLAEQVLKALPKPKTLGALHPFEDDDRWR